MSKFIHAWNSCSDTKNKNDPFRFPRSRFSQNLFSGSSQGGTKGFLTHHWNLSTLSVYAQADEEQVSQMQQRILQLHGDGRLQPLLSHPKPGTFVLAPYSFRGQGQIWGLFRAIVLRRGFLDDAEQITVLFVDLGDSRAEVDYRQCFRMPRHILEKPIFGLIISVPGIPAKVENVLSKNLMDLLADLYFECNFECEGIDSLETISVVNPTRVSKFRVFQSQDVDSIEGSVPQTYSRPIEWFDFVYQMVTSVGKPFPMTHHWNPFSSEGMKAISKACGGDQDKAEQMIDSQLLHWSNSSFPNLLNSVKINQIIVLQDFYFLSAPAFQVDFKPEMWHDGLKGYFRYTKAHVPINPILPGDQITAKMRHFSNLQNWTAMITSQPFCLYRKSLNRKLNEYCQMEQTVNPNTACRPYVGQVWFVYLHTWKEMDEIVDQVGGDAADWRKDRDCIQSSADDSEAHGWYRGFCTRRLGLSGLLATEQTIYEFYLFDLGRYVVVRGQHVLPAIIRFLMVPPLAISGKMAEPFSSFKKAQEEDWIRETCAKKDLELQMVEPNFEGSALVEFSQKFKDEMSSSLASSSQNLTSPRFRSHITDQDCYSDSDDDDED